MAGSEDGGGAHEGGVELPDPVDFPEIPEGSESTTAVEHGLQGVAQAVDTVGRVASAVDQLSSAQGPVDVMGVTSGALTGLAGGLAATAGLIDDAGAQQALGVVSRGMSLMSAGVRTLDRIVDAVDGIVSEENRHRVTFEFETGAFPDAHWRVASFEHDERIGRPFSTTIVLATEDLDLEVPRMLGVNAKLMLRRGEDIHRTIGGIVSRIEVGRTTDRARVITVRLSPALAHLGLRRDSRIFQGLTVVEILDEVVGNALDAYGRSSRMQTTLNNLPREYCVQYGETDLAFVQRLMEEEGITYYFEWDANGVERIVFVDDNSQWPALRSDGASIPFVQQRSETSDTEHVHELLCTTQVRTTTFSLRDLDWTQNGGRADIDARSDDCDDHGSTRESYEHDRAITLGRYAGLQYGPSDADARLGNRRDAHAAEARVFRGAGNVIAMCPGRVISIENHPQVDLDGELVVLAASHRGHAPELHDLIGHARYAHDDLSYECSFEAIPKSVPYRMPLVTPKPRVQGLLSAIVVGSDGQEIHSDEHRRVRVQMRWDRQGTFDDRSSCFVRVMQTWAGQGFGSLFLPRVGMEVAVAFLDGDPDRPMVAGCLYNQDNPPRYTSEQDWTKSSLKSKSSPDPGDGADHFNEIRFEDAAGHEQIYLHAERDLDEEVLHDHSTHVRRNQSNVVGADQSERVRGDQTLRVDGYRRETVAHNEEITIKQQQIIDVGESQLLVRGPLSEDVQGDVIISHQKRHETSVHGEAFETFHRGRDVSVHGSERKLVDGSSHVSVIGPSDVLVSEHHRIVKDGGGALTVAEGITLIVGQNRIEISPNGDIRIIGQQLSLSNGLASINLTESGEIDIIGPAGVNLACGSNTVSLSTTGVSTSGTQISSTAQADHTIVGAIVRIN